jgi:ATP-dependent DNA helicase RecG
MRDEMKKANLSVPLIESNRSSNLFVLTLLPHHLFNKDDIQWLQSFKEHNLTDEDARTLIVIREKGAISNAEYRTINAVDTLTASSHLRRLRDIGLLEQKGRGNATFYAPTTKLLAPGIGLTALHISPLSGELAPHISSLTGEFPSLPEELKKKIANLKKRTSPHEIKNLIKELCSLHPLKLSEISTILGRHSKYIREHYLNDMVKLGELEHTFPESPNHPQQAYTHRE